MKLRHTDHFENHSAEECQRLLGFRAEDSSAVALRLAFHHRIRVFPTYGMRPTESAYECECLKRKRASVEKPGEREPLCHQPGKHPHIMSWPDKATTNLATILRWQAKWLHCNFNALTGAASQLVVVDLDGKLGLNNYAELERQYRTARPMKLFTAETRSALVRNCSS